MAGAAQLRDGGCIHHTCDLPARWTDVMHLNVPYKHNGRLDLGNAALGCHTHHRAYDTDRLRLHHAPDGRPVLRPPDPPGSGTDRRNEEQPRDGPAP